MSRCKSSLKQERQICMISQQAVEAVGGRIFKREILLFEYSYTTLSIHGKWGQRQLNLDVTYS